MQSRLSTISTCAMTGIKIINGRGLPEVQAAHIQPVSNRGPDSVRNGLALSGTVHWMFDRGLITLGSPPEYPILLSKRASGECASVVQSGYDASETGRRTLLASSCIR